LGRCWRSTASTSSSASSRQRGSATFLDAFGGHVPARQTVATNVHELRANEAALRELSIDPAELERRLELATHAADEIDAAAPREGEIDELRVRLSVAGNAQRIVALLAEAHDLLTSEGASARDRVAQAVRSGERAGAARSGRGGPR